MSLKLLENSSSSNVFSRRVGHSMSVSIGESSHALDAHNIASPNELSQRYPKYAINSKQVNKDI